MTPEEQEENERVVRKFQALVTWDATWEETVAVARGAWGPFSHQFWPSEMFELLKQAAKDPYGYGYFIQQWPSRCHAARTRAVVLAVVVKDELIVCFGRTKKRSAPIGSVFPALRGWNIKRKDARLTLVRWARVSDGVRLPLFAFQEERGEEP